MTVYMRFLSFLLIAITIGAKLEAQAQRIPSIAPTMTIVTPQGTEEEVTSYAGSAPLIAHFHAGTIDQGDYQAVYTWTISSATAPTQPYVTRYEADIDYTFLRAETSLIQLTATFIHGTDTLVYTTDQPFSISIATSKLEVPNAFSPNGDGINDVYQVKEGYQSIVSFKGRIFNRWGKLLYTWTDLKTGWDGTIHGTPAPQGVYYCLIQAKGADGIVYNIRRDVNLFRTFLESTTGAMP